ncbi:MAG: DUF1593 domain-containing protein, partial [Tolumonas sp.]|nr:DUF1593 domain-containing protein [Tolumonas sp.]
MNAHNNVILSLRRSSLAAMIALGLSSVVNAAPATGADMVDSYTGSPRIFVLTDIGNEPDDQMSMVRLLMYSNEMDIEGLVATTSTWQRGKTMPETIKSIVDAYGQVRPNLMKHADHWPTQENLESVISSGQTGYGMEDVGKGKSTAGSKALIAAVDKTDNRPIWISVWGGANTLAQALFDVRESRTPAQVKAFEEKLRVMATSDQDDAGPWIRKEFPNVYYIVKPSSQDGTEYAAATWTGIAGDIYYKNGDGADFSHVTNEWLGKNIRGKGPMGKHYLTYKFIMEGDTPDYLALIGNGLNSYQSPSWGGWGGRYIYRQPYGETHAIWTQGGDYFPRVTSADTVTGNDGKEHTSDQASIWRWRNQFQNDFAARMDWSIKPFDKANHNPVVDVNGNTGKEVINLEAKIGDQLVLDASATKDPNGHKLTYRWYNYQEAGFTGVVGKPGLADISLNGQNTKKITVKVNKACRDGRLADPRATCPEGGVAHVILEVT